MLSRLAKFQWQIEVPNELQDGASCDHWMEDGEVELDCIVKVDSCGFFMHWKSESEEGEVLELSQVNDVRTGKVPIHPQTYNLLRQRKGDNFGEFSLTVCSGHEISNVNLNHFVFENKETAEIWRSGLRKLTNNIKMNNVCPMTNLEKHWKRIHLTSTVDGKVSVKAIAKTFASGKAEKLVYQTLKDCNLPNGRNDSIDPGDLTFEKFYEIYKTLCPRTDINDLFKKIQEYSNHENPDVIDITGLVSFLNMDQRDQRLNEILYPLADVKLATEIVITYEKNPDYVAAGLISIDGLTNYLMSDDNAPVILDHLDIYQDMNQPLPHYYINSSHNTYLTGRQIGGKSSVEMYRQVLLAGCRCIELDCWNGKDNGNEPIITHGKAMCTDILFKDVINAIKDCAFITSDYPLILSFENHCSLKQQERMAEHCETIFGELLLKEPLDGFPLEPNVPLPSPNQLKRKILIKNKRRINDLEQLSSGGQPAEESGEDKEDAKSQFSIEATSRESNSDGIASSPDSCVSGSPSSNPLDGFSSSKGSSSQTGNPNLPVISTPYQASTMNVHQKLSSLVVYTQAVKFQGFEAALQDNTSYKMSSFSEHVASGYLSTQSIEFVNYNKKQLSRIFPKGSRVDSSNFLPQEFWNSGCQMVSLNFQTSDLPMQLNQGKFEYNGNCGYLLKPDFMRREDRQFDPFAQLPVDGVIAAQCTVQVISGQFLSDRKVGTYVEVDLYGLSGDTYQKEYKTKVVPSNGLNPMYNEEPFIFRKIILPELAVLRFGVYDDNGKLLGQRILPFDTLQPGYRHIALRTDGNFPMTLPMLFVNIKIEVYIPPDFQKFTDALLDPISAGEQIQDLITSDLGLRSPEESDSSSKPDYMKTKGEKFSVKDFDEKDFEVEYEPINADFLINKKEFQKILKKQVKSMESMRKKHQKERVSVQKDHCFSISKLTKEVSKETSDLEVIQSSQMKLLIEQKAKWTALIDDHRKEEKELREKHFKSQYDALKNLLSEYQLRQVKDLESEFDKEIKKMSLEQAKTSIENSKEVLSENKLQSKAEKERLLKEQKERNAKIFLDQRKLATGKQEQRLKKLQGVHDQQLKDLEKYLEEVYKYQDDLSDYTSSN